MDPYIVYGRRTVEEFLKRPDLESHAVREIWAMEGLPARLIAPLESRFPGRIHSVPRREIDSRYPDINHQGVVVILETGQLPHAGQTKSWRDSLKAPTRLSVGLDNIQDPQNLGSVIRTAEALGTGAVYICGSGAQISPLVDRASSGASMHLPMYMVSNVSVLCSHARKCGLWVVASVVQNEKDGDVISTLKFEQLPETSRILLLLGSEGSGLRKNTATDADYNVTIPLHGKTDSLNVAAAAAILIERIVNR